MAESDSDYSAKRSRSNTTIPFEPIAAESVEFEVCDVQSVVNIDDEYTEGLLGSVWEGDDGKADSSDGFGCRSSEHSEHSPSDSSALVSNPASAALSSDSRIHQENVLQTERLRSTGMLQPWEKPRAWGQQLWERKLWHESAPSMTAASVFRPPPDSDPVLPALPIVPKLLRPTATFASRRLRLVKPKVDEDGLRQRALIKWRIIVESDLLCSTTGIMLASMCENMDSESAISETLHDVFACKSTATMFKRSQSICKYMEWADNKSIDRPLLCIEKDVYEYVKHLRDTCAPATKASAFLQALNFAKYVIGLQCPGNTLKSSRIKGVVRKLLLTKRILRQAELLTVDDVAILETTTHHAECPRDRTAAGHFCYELYCSGRHSDTNNVEQLEWDMDGDGYGFVEGQTCRHKTATTAEKRTRFLPLIAPTWGVVSGSWASSWRQAREDTGLECGSNKPLLPAPNSKGGWTNRALTAGEATTWLRELLLAGGSPKEHVARVSSHSLKATFLSWAAKRGLPIDIRRLMGHHMPPGDTSAINYSRDAMSGVMQAAVDLLQDIRNEIFKPDDNRSSRIRASGLMNVCSGLDQAPVTPMFPEGFGTEFFDHIPDCEPAAFDDTVLSDSSSESDNSSRMDSEASDTIQEDMLLVQKFSPELMVPSASASTEVRFQHNRSGIIHFGDLYNAANLMCGRILHSGYSETANLGSSLWPHCKQCISVFESRPISTISA